MVALGDEASSVITDLNAVEIIKEIAAGDKRRRRRTAHPGHCRRQETWKACVRPWTKAVALVKKML
ncbi:MAG: hypothetical protein MZV63_35310 [Marinilabiliales bacterium]|nr:hypothetical protein [Marinilabiliales bacterium]